LIDGWCLNLLFGDVLALYEAGRSGRVLALPEYPPYRAFLDWLGEQDLGRAEAYWRRTLAGFRAPTDLGLGRAGGEAASRGFAERRRTLAAEQAGALEEFARRHRLTLGTVVQAAWGLLLARYSRRRDVVFGVTVSGRPSGLPGVERMLGLFINTLPLRIEVDEDAALVPWLESIQARQLAIREWEYTPLVQVHGWSDVPRGLPLFESIVVFENYPFDAALERRAAGLGIEDVRVLEQTSFPLTVTVLPRTAAGLTVSIGYDAGRFDGEEVDRLLRHFQALLEGMSTGSASRLADLSMLDAAELALLTQAAPGPSGGVQDAGQQQATTIDGVPDLNDLTEEELNALLKRYLTAPART
jgi:non-ribosomal peptide synthetase component F